MGIAVRVGNRDHNVISIDIDGDELMKGFIDRNPIARKTLISKGSRGANFWFMLSHECLDLQDLKHEGVSVGEFRGNGGVTIIQGLHENKTDYYRFLNKAPVSEIKLDQLKWMDGSPMTEVIRTGKDPVYTRTLELKNNRSVEEEYHIEDGVGVPDEDISNDDFPEAPRLGECDPKLIKDVETIVKKFACVESKTTNNQQLRLIRELKFLLYRNAMSDSWELKSDVHKLWFDLSTPYLDVTMSEQDYLIELIDKWSRLRRTNQENEAVWNRAKQKAAPALLSEKPQTLQDTAKLCREWALKNKKDGVFNLGGKQVELVVPGVNSQVGGFRYLRVLVNLKVIKLTQKGIAQVRTNQWRYLLND